MASSNVSRDYYHSSRSSRQTLPPLRSVLGDELALPVSTPAYASPYDLREIGRALPPGHDHRSSARCSTSMGAYAERSSHHHHDPAQRSYAYAPPTGTAQNGSRHGHGHEYASGVHDVHHAHTSSGRPRTPEYGEDYHHRASAYTSSSAVVSKHGNKKYGCAWPGCGKRFERQNALDTHMNIHTDSKPYACPVPNCCKVFNVRSNMRRHLLTHKDYNGAMGGETIDEDHGASEDYYYRQDRECAHNGALPSVSGEQTHRRTVSASYYSSSRRT